MQSAMQRHVLVEHRDMVSTVTFFKKKERDMVRLFGEKIDVFRQSHM